MDCTKIRYEAGDHAAIFPTNDSELVERIGQLLDVDLGTVFKLVNMDGLWEMNYFYLLFFFNFRGKHQKTSIPVPVYLSDCGKF